MAKPTSKTSAKTAKKKGNDSDDFVSDEAVSSGSASYFKPETGDNKVRIISKPILGWVVWEEDEDDNRTPVRTKIDDEPDKSNYEKDNQPKKFMAVVIIDHADDEVKIWEITQQSIIKAIKALAANEDWGMPFSYDININKKGEKLKTKYVITPSPKKVLSKELVKAANEKPCNLDALYEGEDPWTIEDDAEPTEYHFK
jgi:hypothetical protein